MSKRGAAMAKDQVVKLIVGAGQANPSPPVGPALGSKGVKSIDFCKVRRKRSLSNRRVCSCSHQCLFLRTQEFNARTSHITPGTPMPVRVTVRGDRSFHFDIRTPQTSWLLKNAASCPPGKKGKKKGASQPGHEVAGTISLKHVYEIAKIKATDAHLKHLRLEAIASTIVGTARTIGIEVVP